MFSSLLIQTIMDIKPCKIRTKWKNWKLVPVECIWENGTFAFCSGRSFGVCSKQYGLYPKQRPTVDKHRFRPSRSWALPINVPKSYKFNHFLWNVVILRWCDRQKSSFCFGEYFEFSSCLKWSLSGEQHVRECGVPKNADGKSDFRFHWIFGDAIGSRRAIGFGLPGTVSVGLLWSGTEIILYQFSFICSIHIKLHMPQMIKQHTHTRTIYKTQYVRPNHIYHYHHKPRKYRNPYEGIIQSLASDVNIPEIHTIEPVNGVGGGVFIPRRKRKWPPKRGPFRQYRMNDDYYRVMPTRFKPRYAKFRGYGFNRGDRVEYDDVLQLAGTQLEPTYAEPREKQEPDGTSMNMIKFTADDRIQPKDIAFNLASYDTMTTASAISPEATRPSTSSAPMPAINYAESPTIKLTDTTPGNQEEPTTQPAQRRMRRLRVRPPVNTTPSPPPLQNWAISFSPAERIGCFVFNKFTR